MNKYKVKVWIVVEDESEADAAANVETTLTRLVEERCTENFESFDVDWDSAEEVED